MSDRIRFDPEQVAAVEGIWQRKRAWLIKMIGSAKTTREYALIISQIVGKEKFFGGNL